MPSTASQNSFTPFRAFCEGLTRPSGLSVFIAIFVAAASLIFGSSTIDENWVIHRSPVLRQDVNHERDLITRRALELRTMESDRPIVILVGRGDLGSEPNVAKMPSFGSDHAPAIFDLRTSSQIVWESLAICDQVQRDIVGKLVLYLNLTMLDVGIEEAVQLDRQPDYGFRSASLAVELQKLGRSTVPLRNVYFLDNYSYLIRRLPLVSSRSPTGNSQQLSQPESQSQSIQEPRSVNRHETGNLTRNLPVLESMLERLSISRTLSVSIVFDIPRLDVDGIAPEATSELRQAIDNVRTLAERYQIELTERPAPQTSPRQNKKNASRG